VGAKRDEQGYDANWLNSFAAEAVDRLCWLFQLLSIIAIFLKAERKSISA
jgi:hypothetical protein